MTDSVIQFNYSDGVHLASIYVKGNTHKEDFIPILEAIFAEIDWDERPQKGRLNWGNMCLEFIKRLSQWVGIPSGIKLISETNDDECNVIYKHVIQPIEEDYSCFDIPTSKALNIISKYPIGGELIYTGTLFDFVVELKSKNETVND